MVLTGTQSPHFTADEVPLSWVPFLLDEGLSYPVPGRTSAVAIATGASGAVWWHGVVSLQESF